MTKTYTHNIVSIQPTHNIRVVIINFLKARRETPMTVNSDANFAHTCTIGVLIKY